MAAFEWNQGFSVGVDELDRQHKGLIALVNRLHEAMREGKGMSVVDGVVNELVAYTRLHFKKEEEMMERYGYAGLAEHRQAHKEFVARVGSLIAEARMKKVGLAVRVADFLKQWLVGHIQGTDKLYTGHFASHGVH